MRLAAVCLTALALAGLLLGPDGFGLPAGFILWEIRVPRVVLALLVGAGLGMSGAALQGALRNPLADPGFLGIGGCAALGAVAAYYWGAAAALPVALVGGGFAGATLGALVLLAVAARAPGGPGLILAGVGLASVAGAALALALALAPSPFALYEITFWLMGGVADRTLAQVALAAPPVLAGCLLLGRLGRAVDAFSLGEETAASLGVSATALGRRLVLGVALAVGAGTAVAGGIGFVGLIVPNLLRPLVGARPGALLWPSAIGGAALVAGADLVCRLLTRGCELSQPLPLGVVTALIGAPLLIHAALRARMP